MRGVDLAIYADALAGEAASVAARAERARSRLRQAAIEQRARGDLTETAVSRLEALGLLSGIDQAAVRNELRELDAALEALDELQAWVEQQLAADG
jgi:Spy/CpxP family protein refolding chaperone